MLPETTSGVAKIVTGSLVAGSGAVYAVAAATDAAPLPDLHGMVELLIAASIAYIWTQINGLKKKESSVDAPKPDGTKNDWLLSHLERIAYGVESVNKELTNHRVDFGEFRGQTEARLASLERKVDKLEQKRTGEIPRPT